MRSKFFNTSSLGLVNIHAVIQQVLTASVHMEFDRAYATGSHALGLAHGLYEIDLRELDKFVSDASGAIRAFQYMNSAVVSIRNGEWELPMPVPHAPPSLHDLTLIILNIVAQSLQVDALCMRHAGMVPLMARYRALRAGLFRINSELDDIDGDDPDSDEQEDANEEFHPFIRPMYDAVEQMRLHLTKKIGFVGLQVRGAEF